MNFMKFWNNPENTSQKILLVIGLLVAGGYIAYSLGGGSGSLFTGKVFDGTKKGPQVKPSWSLFEVNENNYSNQRCSYNSEGGGSSGSSCSVTLPSCTTYQGTTQECPGSDTVGFGCCCVSSNDTCYPINSAVGKDDVLTDIDASTDINPLGGDEEETGTQIDKPVSDN